MPLVNTTIIPIKDDTLTEDEYKELILKLYNDLFTSEKIILVVLGVSEAIEKGVELADELADTSPTNEKRWVMWVKDPAVLKEQLEPILLAANIILDDTPYEEIKAFCLTKPDRKALSRVHKNGEMDFVRLEALFVEAEKASVAQS